MSGDNPKVSFIIEDWTLVQDELRKACENLPKTSREYMASKEALACAMDEGVYGGKVLPIRFRYVQYCVESWS